MNLLGFVTLGIVTLTKIKTSRFSSDITPLTAQTVVKMQNTPHVVNAVQTAYKSSAVWRLLETPVSS